MSSDTCDVIVMGCGGFGSAAMYHLARQGQRVIGIDRFHPPHELGSSHGETRIIRKAYFEHPDYVPLLHRAWDLWEELAQESAQPLLERRDMLMSGPPGSEVLEGARLAAKLHHLPLAELTQNETMLQFPMLQIPADYQVIVESTAGILRVESCVKAHLELAQARGAKLRCGETVQKISGSSNGLMVQTDRATYSAGAGIMTCGAWTGQLLPDYVKLISVLRKTLFWHAIQSNVWAAPQRAPIFFLDTPDGQFYGLPSVDGKTIKVAEHTGGETIADTSMFDRINLERDEASVSSFVSKRLFHVETRPCRAAVCMYSMSPDGHFLFDRLTDMPLVVAGGFSGHGFKFASVLGDAAAALILHGTSSFDVDFLSTKRFAANRN